jgi:hypothetical protein
MNNAIDQDLLRLYAAYRKSDPDEPLDRNPHLAWDDVVREHRKICAERLATEDFRLGDAPSETPVKEGDAGRAPYKIRQVISLGRDGVPDHVLCENGEIWRLTFMGWGRVDFPPIPHWGAWS